MGFASGLPLALTGATLGLWLAEAGVSRTTIGLFALVGISYNFKFVWAPLIDRLPIPGLTTRLGKRRGWALALQALLALAILGLAQADPRVDPYGTALFAVLVAFLSASQDIVIDAFRVELLKDEEQGPGAGATQFGYRIGMLASGAGALYLAQFHGWSVAFTVMAGLMVAGMAAVLLAPEPETSGSRPAPATAAAWIAEAVVAPFLDFAQRHAWVSVLIFVVLYKLGDALAGIMAGPFYVAMGFSKIEIANISKIFGVGATMLGVFLGGLVAFRLGTFRALMLCGALQALSNLMFALQAHVGYDVPLLTLTIAIENVTGGMGSSAFVAYLSGLCGVGYTATQYALLSALAAVPRTVLASSGGWLSEQMDWVPFFLFTAVAALPGLVLLAWLMRRKSDRIAA